MKKILLLLSETLLDEHVGVKRVAIFYGKKLNQLGVHVDLGFFKKGRFYKVTDSKIVEDFYSYKISNRKLTKRRVTSVDSDYYSSILISCPWLVTSDFPILKNTIGVVLDMIPNLISLNIVKFPGRFIDCNYFAFEHSRGYLYFIKYSTKILSISLSTTHDFLVLTKSSLTVANKIKTILPFEKRESVLERRDSDSILLVNCMDPRKNLMLACEVFSDLSVERDFSVKFVGKPRANESYLNTCFDILHKASVKYSWEKNCSDKKLEELYTSSKCLFFPSIYEGLGLPILEAQNFNCPVVTSIESSCGEVAFFPELLTTSNDRPGFVRILDRILIEKPKFQNSFEHKWTELFSKYDDLTTIEEFIIC